MGTKFDKFKELLKKALKWVASNAYQVLILVAIIFGVVKIRDFAREVKRGMAGEKKTNFSRFPGDEDHIAVKTKEGWETVKLPEKVKSQDVKDAGISTDNSVLVEVKHEKVDYRDTSDYSGESRLGLGKSGD